MYFEDFLLSYISVAQSQGLAIAWHCTPCMVKIVIVEILLESLTLGSLTVKHSLSRLDIQKVVHFEGT